MRKILPILLFFFSFSCAKGTEGPVCGNGVIERGEECDREDVNGATCQDLGFGRGVVTCGAFCLLSTAACFPACTSTCDVTGALRCQGNQLEICRESEDGCMYWEQQTDCASLSLVCNEFLNPPACSDSCQDTCTADSSRCFGYVIQECETGASGCTQWMDKTRCNDLQMQCTVNDGQAVCSAECPTQCASEGLRRCEEETAQVCVEDAVGCRVFIDIQDCQATSQFCVDGFCADCPPAPCTQGTRRCNGLVIETCNPDSNGCLGWIGGKMCVYGCQNGFCTTEFEPRY